MRDPQSVILSRIGSTCFPRTDSADLEGYDRTRAAERPLFLAPEEDRDRGLGKRWLYEYEASRATTTTTTSAREADGG